MISKRSFRSRRSCIGRQTTTKYIKTLIQLLKDDLATSETQHQESLPSKKIYTITGKGAQKLAAWVESPPELPEMKKSFLIQLVWAGSLDAQRLDALLENYEQEMSAQVLIRKEMKKRGCFSPARSGLEAFLWEAAQATTSSRLTRRNMPGRRMSANKSGRGISLHKQNDSFYNEVFKMTFTIQNIQALREKTGAGMMDCKNALTKANGNLELAENELRERGMIAVVKKAERVSADGIAYAAVIGDKAVLLEINTETDFAGKKRRFYRVCRERGARDRREAARGYESALAVRVSQRRIGGGGGERQGAGVRRRISVSGALRCCPAVSQLPTCISVAASARFSASASPRTQTPMRCSKRAVSLPCRLPR